jgi:hypothetical protein
MAGICGNRAVVDKVIDAIAKFFGRDSNGICRDRTVMCLA